MSEKKWLTVKGVAEKYHRKQSWVFALAKSDPTFPKARRFGASRFWEDGDLDRWWDSVTTGTVEPPAHRGLGARGVKGLKTRSTRPSQP